MRFFSSSERSVVRIESTSWARLKGWMFRVMRPISMREKSSRALMDLERRSRLRWTTTRPRSCLSLTGPELAVEDVVGVPLDGREGRAELVAHVGEEVGLHAVQLLQLVVGRAELLVGLLELLDVLLEPLGHVVEGLGQDLQLVAGPDREAAVEVALGDALGPGGQLLERARDAGGQGDGHQDRDQDRHEGEAAGGVDEAPDARAQLPVGDVVDRPRGGGGPSPRCTGRRSRGSLAPSESWPFRSVGSRPLMASRRSAPSIHRSPAARSALAPFGQVGRVEEDLAVDVDDEDALDVRLEVQVVARAAPGTCRSPRSSRARTPRRGACS